MGEFASPYLKYLTVDEEARRWMIFCTDTGFTSISPGESYPPRVKSHPPEYRADLTRGRILREHQIVYITRGGGFFRSTGFPRTRVSPGTAFFLFPGIWHSYAPDADTGWDEYWVGFNGEYPARLVENCCLRPEDSLFRPGLHDGIVDSFHEIFSLAENEAKFHQISMGALVIKLIAAVISYDSRAKRDSREDGIVRDVRCFFEENIGSIPDMEGLARILAVSESVLTRVFKRHTGLTPYHYFLQMKINKAKMLLTEGELPVKGVAFRLGFESQHYFSRLFKIKTGVSPTEWQRGSHLRQESDEASRS